MGGFFYLLIFEKILKTNQSTKQAPSHHLQKQNKCYTQLRTKL